MRSTGATRAPSVAAARGDLAYEIDHHQQNHRAGEGDHNTQAELIGGIGADYGRQQPSARQPADDAHQDVSPSSLSIIGLHYAMGHPAHCAANNQPDDHVHTPLLRLFVNSSISLANG